MELPPTSAALLVEFGAETDGELDKLVAGAEEILREHEMIRAARLHPRSGAGRGLMDRARGTARPDRALPAAGDVADHRGRLRPAGADRRVGAGHPGACSPSTASCPASRATPRRGTCTSCSPRTSPSRRTWTATRRSWRSSSTLILDKYDGSLKAEHGTGVNMSPYVEREWGKKATELMWRVKALADPDGVLAPGVVLNRDDGAHLRNLKTTPEIEEVANTCVECGFCEPVCPSRHLTTTPRQRIVIRREMARQPGWLPGAAGAARAVRVRRDPDLRRRRHLPDRLSARDRHRQADQGVPRRGAHRQGPARRRRGSPSAGRRSSDSARAGLRAGAVAGPLMRAGAARHGRCSATSWSRPGPRNMPPPAPAKLPRTVARGRGGRLHARLRQPDLRSRRAATGPGFRSPEAMVAVSARAGLPVWIPDDVDGQLLLGPVGIEGLHRGREADGRPHHRGALALERGGGAARRDRRELLLARPRRGGTGAHAELEVLDSVAWAERLLPNLEVRRSSAPSRSTRPARRGTWGSSASSREIAAAMAEEVVQPIRATCCGMAGDRGMLHPELTESATAEEAAELAGTEPRRLSVQQPDLRDRPAGGDRRRLRVLPDPARADHAALSAETGSGLPR